MIFQPYRTKYNGVPILQKTEIDTIAEKYISDFNPVALKEPVEIDIDSFVLNYLGLSQDFQYLSHNGVYLGMMVFNNTDKVPVYVPETNKAEYISAKARTVIIDSRLLKEGQEHRYRYTMGHEGAHDIFHRGYFSCRIEQPPESGRLREPIIQCRAIPVGGKMKPVSEWDDRDSMEWQANYFSAAMLMPRSMVLKLLRDHQQYCRNLDNMNCICLVAYIFNVSWHAAVNRLRSLGILKVNIELQSAIADFSRPL